MYERKDFEIEVITIAKHVFRCGMKPLNNNKTFFVHRAVPLPLPVFAACTRVKEKNIILLFLTRATGSMRVSRHAFVEISPFCVRTSCSEHLWKLSLRKYFCDLKYRRNSTVTLYLFSAMVLLRRVHL